MVYILQAKGITHKEYTILGVYTEYERALLELEKFPDITCLIISVKEDEVADYFVCETVFIQHGHL